MIVHYTDAYLLNPQHKITVNLIGIGGTGSQVLTALAMTNMALISLGHPGIHVYGYDGDVVSGANIGRQLFSDSDIGINKAVVLISRINRHFGYEWVAIPSNYNGLNTANITISCVDTAVARLDIGDLIHKSKPVSPLNRPIYWLDYGNLKNTGQVILGTVNTVKQPAKSQHTCVSKLMDVVQKFPQLKKIKEKNQGPSCSLAQSLKNQGLTTNPTLAWLGIDILLKLFQDCLITYHGYYMNLNTGHVNPIKIS